jgi:hydrogenase/urease accessory protein HupE
MSGMRLNFRRPLLGIIGLLALPAPAQAHTQIQGAGDIVGGLLHPLTAPAHVLILLGLGLFCAQRTSRRSLTPLAAFALALALALPLTMTSLLAAVPMPVLSGIALVIAAAVALRKPIPIPASCALFAMAAIAIGLDSGVEKGTHLTIIKTLFGTWLGAIALLTCVTVYVGYLPRKEWVKIGLRVLASWIFAISLLMLAFSWRK